MSFRSRLLLALAVVVLAAYGLPAAVRTNVESVALSGAIMKGVAPETLPELRRACADGRAAISNHPNLSALSGSEAWRLGWIAAARGHCVEAITYWHHAASMPGDRQRAAAFELGRTLYSLGDPAAADAFRQAAAAQYVAGLAGERVVRGDVGGGIEQYGLAADAGAPLEDIERLADLLRDRGEVGKAMALWQRLQAGRSHEDPVYWRAQAALAAGAKDWASARRALERAAALLPEAARYDLWIRQIRVLTGQSAWADVIATAAQAIALRPSHSSEPYIAAGKAAAQLGRRDDARRWFDRGLAAIPADPWPNIAAGDAAWAARDMVEAERRYRSALSQEPRQFVASYFLGILLSEQGKPAESAVVLEAIADSGNCEVLRVLSRDYRIIGRPADADRVAASLGDRCK